MQATARQVATAQARSGTLQTRSIFLALLIGFLFLLPHIAGIATAGSFRAYTPFSVITPSNVISDESFLYGAQTNTMLQQHRRADDTDSWEGRNTWFPYSFLPESVEAVTAAVLAPGHPRTGLKLAQILFHFAFPAIMAALLMALFDLPEIPTSLAALLALTVMVASFSARTLTGSVLAVLSHSGGAAFANPLQASRNPNPNVSFVIVLVAIWLAVRACRSLSNRSFAIAGVVGGLLFYCYTFYAIAWSAACLLLALASLVPVLRLPRGFLRMLAATVVTALPYLAWVHVSKRSGVYVQRTGRLGMVYSHRLPPESLHTSLEFGIPLFVLLITWLLVLRRHVQQRPGGENAYSAILVTTALGLGGIAGLDMQIVTGFNVQADFHYTHMVIQPAAVLIVALLIACLLGRRGARWVAIPGFVVLWIACALIEAHAGIASAPYQQLPAGDAVLFDWLETHTRPGDVLATTNLRLCMETPLFTHNRLLVANGTRASGSDEQLLERLLVANRLSGATEQQVRAELAVGDALPDAVPFETYGTYLFEQSPLLNPYTHYLTDAAVASALEQYSRLNVDRELTRYRVDYLYTEHGGSPQPGSAWQAAPVLETPGGGVLWRITRRS